MKIYQIIILFSLIVIISSGCKDIDPTGKKDCWDKLSDEEKKNIHIAAIIMVKILE